MAQFNGYTVVKRYNRPSVLTKTLLEMFFSNNGSYFDPYTVSAAYILPDAGICNGSPDIYINRDSSAIGTEAYGLLHPSALSSVLATYNISSNSDAPYHPSSYSGVTTAACSGIFSGLEGEPKRYQIISDGAAFLNFSAVGDYFDMWLVKDFSAVDASAGWQLYWNKFSVYSDRIVSYTEPFEVTSRNKLRQKYIPLSSVIDLAVETEVFLANKNLAMAEKDIWRDAVIDSSGVAINIERRNPQTTGQNTSIVSWATSGITINSANTILYKWDTAQEQVGDYSVQVKYTLLGQTFYSEKFSVVLR